MGPSLGPQVLLFAFRADAFRREEPFRYSWAPPCQLMATIQIIPEPWIQNSVAIDRPMAMNRSGELSGLFESLIGYILRMCSFVELGPRSVRIC
jgi:hypothetical protein